MSKGGPQKGLILFLNYEGFASEKDAVSLNNAYPFPVRLQDVRHLGSLIFFLSEKGIV